MRTRVIWTYWHQGWSQAPALVRQCVGSWARLNPEYELRALDRRTLLDHIDWPEGIDVERKDLTVQKVAALGRLALLCRHGGVWADATVICARPLSAWLDDRAGAFFAFRNPGPDRLMSNWFIAAEPGSVLLQRLYRDFAAFFARNRFTNQGTPLGDRLLALFGRRWCSDVAASVRWHSWFARRVLRVYPYFIFHYTFNRLILTDPACAGQWQLALPLSAEPPHRLLAHYYAGQPAAVAAREIDADAAPVYKLDWRIDSASPYWAAVLAHLQEHHDRRHPVE